jgi:hypothetical protein
MLVFITKYRIIQVIVTCLLLFLSITLVNFIIKHPIHYSIYEGRVMIYHLIKQPIWMISIILSLTLAVYGYYRKIHFTKIEKIILYSCNAVILINTIFLDPNYYFNQTYLFERLLLLGIFIVSFRFPTISIFYIIYSLLFIKQLQVPDIVYYTFTDKKVFYELSIISVLSAFLYNLFRLHKREIFFVVSIWVVFSMWYLLAAYGKLEFRWWENQLYHLSSASFVYGWLEEFPNFKVQLYSFLKNYNTLFLILTLILETGVIILFINKYYGYLILVGLIGFHAMVFISSGIFFWKWIILLAIFIYIITKINHKELFNYKTLGLSSCLFIFMFLAFPNASKLGWLDTNLVNFHKIKAIDHEGTSIDIDASYFAPYDLIFAQNRFYYLINKNTLNNTYGSNFDRDISRKIITSSNSQTISLLIENEGVNKYSKHKSESMKNFIRKFSTNKSYSSYFFPLSSPMHIWQGKNQKRLVIDPKKLIFNYMELNTINYPEVDTIYTNELVIELGK